MFTALLVGALIAVFGSAAFVVARSSRGELGGGDQKQLPPMTANGNLLERTVRDLRVGDIVQYETRDYLVEGTLNYDEAGHRWTAGRLIDSGDEKWLIVGMEKAGTDTVRLTEIADIDISGYPPETMIAGGTRYNLDSRGTATAKASGQTDVIGSKGLDPDSVHRCRWWRYEGTGGKCLILEQWGDAYRVLRGASIRMSDLELMPGS
jgi:hypothetical protein